jgi:hypothetical protein
MRGWALVAAHIVRAAWLPWGLVGLVMELVGALDNIPGDTMSESVRDRVAFSWAGLLLFALIHWLVWHWCYRPRSSGFTKVDVAFILAGVVGFFIWRRFNG